MTDEATTADGWPSGLTGAQCDQCARTTVVRQVSADEWLCRSCFFGLDDGVTGACLGCGETETACAELCGCCIECDHR